MFIEKNTAGNMKSYEVKFILYGEPRGQMRSRSARTKKSVRHYKDPIQESWESRCWQAAHEARPPVKLLEGPINLCVRVYKAIPKSWSAKKKEAAAHGTLRPTSRPDMSNYIKNIEDVCNQLIWKDDAQVISFEGSGKWYTNGKPRMEVIITEY